MFIAFPKGNKFTIYTHFHHIILLHFLKYLMRMIIFWNNTSVHELFDIHTPVSTADKDNKQIPGK